MEAVVGFIGLGLIGGSIAKGLKRAHPEIKIMAYMRSSSRLEKAFISPVRQTVVGLHPQQIAVIVHSLLHVIYKNTDVRQADNVRQFGPDHARFVVTHLLCPLIQWSEHW